MMFTFGVVSCPVCVCVIGAVNAPRFVVHAIRLARKSCVL